MSHPEWEERFSWLVHGVTVRGPAAAPFDLALFGPGEAAVVQERWAALIRETAMERVVHGRQVHGSAVRLHREGPPGLELAPATDGHVTATPGVLLAVTVADCVPVL
ncbi:MAG TPA: laccase domain-containing protein, partial [Longimicrobiales bacterium]|nr:laccase domain-containing protein [Longimicrobiales bacterium]